IYRHGCSFMLLAAQAAASNMVNSWSRDIDSPENDLTLQRFLISWCTGYIVSASFIVFPLVNVMNIKTSDAMMHCFKTASPIVLALRFQKRLSLGKRINDCAAIAEDRKRTKNNRCTNDGSFKKILCEPTGVIRQKP